MTQKIFLRIAGTIFGLVALLHVLRLVFGWEVVIGSFSFPVWPSWVAPFIAGYLAYEGFRLSRKS